MENNINGYVIYPARCPTRKNHEFLRFSLATNRDSWHDGYMETMTIKRNSNRIEISIPSGAAVAILRDGDSAIEFDKLADTEAIFGGESADLDKWERRMKELGLDVETLRAIDAAPGRPNTEVR